MTTDPISDNDLLQKIRSLPPEKVLEVADFVDFLRHRDIDRHLVRAAGAVSSGTFSKVWDNPDDAAYDAL